jgi:hypothetical protein
LSRALPEVVCILRVPSVERFHPAFSAQIAYAWLARCVS